MKGEVVGRVIETWSDSPELDPRAKEDYEGSNPGRLVARGAGVEVWISARGEVVVLGTPIDQEDETEERLRHDCDIMGCGLHHVIWRSEV